MSLHEPTPPSMWKEGDRLRWRIENSLSHKSTYTIAPNNAPPCQEIARYVAVSYQSARLAGYHPPLSRSPLYQRKRALLRCTVAPISRTRRLSPTAGAVPLFQRKRAFLRCTVLVMQKARFLLEGGLWFVGYWMVLVREPMFWMVTVMVSPGWR